MTTAEMSEEELDLQYRKMIDSFIDQANDLVPKSNPENVSMALLHAASRFNAFVVSTHAETLDDYENDIDKAKVFFMSKYDEMLSENLEDYKEVYKDELKYAHLMS